MKRWIRILLMIGALAPLVVLTFTMGNVGGIGVPSPSLAPLMPLDQRGRGIQVRGDVVYIMDSRNIMVFDISKPLSPQQLSVIPVPEGSEAWQEFDVQGDFLYAFEFLYRYGYSGSVHIFDVSNPKAPVEVVQIDGPGFYGFGFPGLIKASADNRYLHLSASSPDPILVYDISDLSQPYVIATYADECTSQNLTLAGQRAYVVRTSCEGETSQTFSMAIYDLSNPTAPVLISDDKLRELTLGVSSFDESGDKLYLNTSEDLGSGNKLCGIRIVDVADPTQPVLLGKIEWNATGCGTGIRAKDNLLYFINNFGLYDWDELQTYDVSDPENISLVARYQLPKQLNNFYPYDLKDNCVYWMRRYSTTGLYAMCTAGVAASTPTPTSTHAPTSTPSSTPQATATATPTLTSTPSATPIQSPTATPTATVTSTSVVTSTFTPSSTPQATATATPTLTSTPSSTPIQSPTATSTSTAGYPMFMPLLRMD